MKLEDILTEKDYQDTNGHWVLVYDVEFWERTGKQENTLPVFAHVDMSKDWWIPNQETMYKAREHWVTTTEPYKVTTPKVEYEKIKQRQEEIYWEIVNEFLEWYKTEFLAGLKNAPDEKGFLESELEDWRNYKFPRDVIKGWRHFYKIVPRCVEEIFPIIKGRNNNYQPKEEARYRFFKWLEKYHLSDETPMPLVVSTEQVMSKVKKSWRPDFTKAIQILNRFNTVLDHEATKEVGKQNPRTLTRIVGDAIAGIEHDSSIGIKEKQLTRYIKEIHKKTAKQYAGHFVRQNFKGKIKRIS